MIAARRISEDDCKVLLHLMAGSKEDTETGAFFQEHTRAGSATPLLVVSDGAAGVHHAIKEQPQGRTASASRLLWSALLAVQSSKESLNEAGPSLLFYVHTTPRYSTGGSSGRWAP